VTFERSELTNTEKITTMWIYLLGSLPLHKNFKIDLR
jgi:hypothetical protein